MYHGNLVVSFIGPVKMYRDKRENVLINITKQIYKWPAQGMLQI